MKRKSLYLLVLIFLLGVFIRFYRLGDNIPPLYSDQTGGHYWYWLRIVDPSINIFNRIFRIILTIPDSLVWLFGFNTFAARLSSAIGGSILIIASYLFGLGISQLFVKQKSQSISLIMALLIAISPWSFMVGCLYGGIIFMLIMVLLHIFLFVRAKDIRTLLVCLIPLLIASAYYSSMVIIAPIAAILVFLEIWKLSSTTQKKFIIIGSLLLSVTGMVYFVNRYQLFNSNSRGLDLAIWRDVNTSYDTDKYRAVTWNSQTDVFSFYLPPEHLANKIFLNKIIANLTIFSKNYFSFFSPDWLFLRGDPILRHSTGMIGEIYPFLIPFLIYGVYIFFRQNTSKNKLIFLTWILVSPIPAGITKDGYGYLLRAITILPFLTYFSALGLVGSFDLISKKWKVIYGILIALIGIYSVLYFFYGYFHIYPFESARSYEYGFKELSDFQEAHGNKSLLIIWDGYYHNYDFRFWQHTPYDQYTSFQLNKINIGSNIFWQTFPNLFFTNTNSKEDLKDFITRYHPDYVVLPDKYFVNYPDELLSVLGKQTDTIYNPDKTPALNIYGLNTINQKIK